MCFPFLRIVVMQYLIIGVYNWNREKCLTYEGVPCVFPFGYKGKVYNTCTSVDSIDGFWCAVSVESSGSMLKFGYCTNDCPADIPAPVKQVCESHCLFPFSYRDKLYYNCTSYLNQATPWCATTIDTTYKMRTWANCTNDCPIEAECITDDGPCIFPFIYNTKSYFTCTYEGSAFSWCATKVDSKLQMLKWDKCNNLNKCKSDFAHSDSQHLSHSIGISIIVYLIWFFL